MRVLVIEDEAALNGILAKRLTEEGHSVDCCSRPRTPSRIGWPGWTPGRMTTW